MSAVEQDQFLNALEMSAPQPDPREMDDPYFEEPEPECACTEYYVDVDRTEVWSYGCAMHGGAR